MISFRFIHVFPFHTSSQEQALSSSMKVLLDCVDPYSYGCRAIVIRPWQSKSQSRPSTPWSAGISAHTWHQRPCLPRRQAAAQAWVTQTVIQSWLLKVAPTVDSGEGSLGARLATSAQPAAGHCGGQTDCQLQPRSHVTEGSTSAAGSPHTLYSDLTPP